MGRAAGRDLRVARVPCGHRPGARAAAARISRGRRPARRGGPQRGRGRRGSRNRGACVEEPPAPRADGPAPRSRCVLLRRVMSSPSALAICIISLLALFVGGSGSARDAAAAPSRCSSAATARSPCSTTCACQRCATGVVRIGDTFCQRGGGLKSAIWSSRWRVVRPSSSGPSKYSSSPPSQMLRGAARARRACSIDWALMRPPVGPGR